MSSAITWCLDRYARFINRNTKECGFWKPYDNEKEKLVMALTQQSQLMIIQGSTLLESHNLMAAGSIIRGLSRTDSLLFLYKLKDETRRFKVKFSPSESKSGQEICATAVQVLSEFVMIKTSITVNLPGASNQENRYNHVTGHKEVNHKDTDISETSSFMHREITVGTMAKALVNKTNLPLVYYQCQTDYDLIPQLLQTCLADPVFPAYVEAVENSIKALISNNS